MPVARRAIRNTSKTNKKAALMPFLSLALPAVSLISSRERIETFSEKKMELQTDKRKRRETPRRSGEDE
jgi:hypothetical protein